MNLTSTQTKVISIIILILFIPIELFFLAAMIVILLGDEEGKGTIAFSMVFTMAMFFLPLRWGYLNWKRWKQKSAPAPSSVSLDANTIVHLQTKIGLPEYRRLMYQLSYSNSIFIYLHVIGLGIFFSTLMSEGKGQWFGLFSIFFLLYLPIAIYRSANTNYKATKAIHETLQYELNTENITLTGETFNTSMQWSTFHKARETKNWFLLYTNKQVAMLIPKRAFASSHEIDTFREMTKKIQ